jgi:hypothetical protein
MREAHHKSLVLGVYPSRLKKLRKKEIDRALSYWNKGNQSHRTTNPNRGENRSWHGRGVIDKKRLQCVSIEARGFT